MGSSLDRGALLHKRYRIVEILGQGGMGSVYRAVDENLGVDVAVKENLFTTDEYARQFRLEAVILANLRHPNLPRVTDHFVISDQGQYLIMDYIEGEDMRQRMERTGTITEEEAVLVGAAMCDALQYLHTRKPVIIHRDMKPGNVRITPDGHIFLVDFGLAKLVKGSQATTTGARAMTPGYSPPEQYGTARTDPRTDIYSLGATLYAALSGVIPEDGLARAMDNVDLTPLRKRNPKISRKLAAAVEKAMAIRPEDRFQTADEFKDALLTSNIKTQHLEGDLVVEPPPQSPDASGEEVKFAGEMPESGGVNQPPRPPSRPRKRGKRPRGWIYFPLLLSILFLGLVFAFFFWPPFRLTFFPVQMTATPDPVTPIILVTNTPLPVSAQETATSSPTPTASLTPTMTVVLTPTLGETATLTLAAVDTYQLAIVSDQTGAPQIFLINSDGTNPHQVTNMPDGACQPSWSPDGMRLAFISPCLSRTDQYPDANIYIIAVDGTGLTELMPDETGNFDPAWSPDSTRIAFTSLRDGTRQIYILNLTDDSVTALTAFSTDVLLPDWSDQPAWSPSGTQITYTAHSRLTNAMQIWVMSDAGRGQTQLIHRGDQLWNFLPDWSPDGKTILFSETNGDQELGWLMRFDYEHKTSDAVHLRTGTYGTYGDYSPDGLWVAYEGLDLVNSARMDYDIYLIKSDGTGPITRLTNDPTMEFDPAWRPKVTP
jgi:serine/threonine protein kinase/Tol biopolymer transport system component